MFKVNDICTMKISLTSFPKVSIAEFELENIFWVLRSVYKQNQFFFKKNHTKKIPVALNGNEFDLLTGDLFC